MLGIWAHQKNYLEKKVEIQGCVPTIKDDDIAVLAILEKKIVPSVVGYLSSDYMITCLLNIYYRCDHTGVWVMTQGRGLRHWYGKT